MLNTHGHEHTRPLIWCANSVLGLLVAVASYPTTGRGGEPARINPRVIAGPNSEASPVATKAVFSSMARSHSIGLAAWRFRFRCRFFS